MQDALNDAPHWLSPVVLMGTGLTAVDMVMSLRCAGYGGQIIAASRRGVWPQPHAMPDAVFAFTPEEIAAQQTLQQFLCLVRKKIDEVGQWRVVIDALRVHTQSIWKRLGTPDQQRFLSRLLPLWNTHRHRMAPEIAARIAAEITQGTLRVMTTKMLHVSMEKEGLSITTQSGIAQPVGRIINCTGPQLNLARSGNALLRQLLAEGAVEMHANGLGVATDRYRRAWGTLHPNLYVIGALLTGQLLESTAVPELRQQAAEVAKSIHAVVTPE